MDFFFEKSDYLLSTHHCNVFVNHKTHFKLGQFLINEAGDSPIPCHCLLQAYNSCLLFLLPFALGLKKDLVGCATLTKKIVFNQSIIYLHCQKQQNYNFIETFKIIILDRREATN